MPILPVVQRVMIGLGGRRVRVTLPTRAPRVLAALISAGLLFATVDASGAVSHTTKANRRAAISDAARLLAGVTPPSGSAVVWRRSATGPQENVPLLTTAFASAVASERWRVPGAPDAVLSDVESHLPPGSKVVSTGSGGPHPTFQSVTRAWSPVSGRLDVRWLEIVVAANSSGGTALTAESQSQWIVARPTDERVPAGVTEVDVSKGLPGRPPRLARHVTAPRTVRRLVTLFNSLAIVQPGAINCPAATLQPIVTVAFRGGATGGVLASATVVAGADFSWPDTVAAWACFPIGFTAGGHRLDSLAGNVISPIDHRLHVRLQRHR